MNTFMASMRSTALRRCKVGRAWTVAQFCRRAEECLPDKEHSHGPRIGLVCGATSTTQEVDMPIVTIQVTREGTTPGAGSVTAEQKAALIKGASELLLDVLNKPLESTFVVIEEVDTDNWGWGGLPVVDYRKKLAKDRAAR
jgi:4-oxalocrotonate tautomerase